MTLMVAPPVIAVVVTVVTVMVPAIIRPDNDACSLGRYAGGGNTADCDHRGDQ
jgi:hypothetical protein